MLQHAVVMLHLLEDWRLLPVTPSCTRDRSVARRKERAPKIAMDDLEEHEHACLMQSFRIGHFISRK